MNGRRSGRPAATQSGCWCHLHRAVRSSDPSPSPRQPLVWLGLLLASLIGGCSLWPAAPPTALLQAPPPVLRLQVLAPEPLAALLARHLDLGRVNRLAGGEPLPAGELERLLAAAPAQGRALLDTEGYFNAVLRFERLDTAGLPTVQVHVDPGPRTHVRQVQISIEGPLAEAAPTQAHAGAAAAALRQDWPLPVGAAFRQADWARAKTAALAGLRAQAYVQAEWRATEARIDAATQTAELSATVASGALFRVGPLQVQGLQVHDASTVAHIANLQPGEPATELMLLDIQERLQQSDLFDRASVVLDTTPPRPDATPVRISLSERDLQEATVGVGIGANVGTRLTLSHVHRRPFGKAWLARNHVDLAQLRQRWVGEISSHTLTGLYRNLVGGSLERQASDTDVVRALNLRIGRAQETRHISRLLFADWNRSSTRSLLGQQQSDALGLHYHGIWRSLDDLVLPTRGRVWSGQFGVGQARSAPGGSGPFTRVYARLDAFQPWGGWFGSGRLELGQVFARGDVVVPEALRFRAGGDESVRGYAYRSLTREVNGTQVGSEVLFTASLELARPILARLPQLWGAVFVDAGRAAGRWADLRPAVGVGAGLRYRSPVGPVKLDLAYGEEERRLRLHLSVGLVF